MWNRVLLKKAVIFRNLTMVKGNPNFGEIFENWMDSNSLKL